VCCPFFCVFLRSKTFLWSRLGLLPPCFDLFFPAFGFCSLCLAPNCQIRFHHFVRSCFDFQFALHAPDPVGLVFIFNLLFTHQIQSVLSSFSISPGAVLCSSPGHKCFPSILSAGIFSYRQVHLCRGFRFACFGFWRCQGHYSSLWFFIPPAR
jgi:hypothetical protein